MPAHDWLEHHRSALEWVPFASVWMGTRAADRPLLTRSTEQLIMAIVAAGLALIANDKIQDRTLADLTRQVEQLQDHSARQIANLHVEILALREQLHAITEQRQPPQKRKLTL